MAIKWEPASAEELARRKRAGVAPAAAKSDTKTTSKSTTSKKKA